MLASASVSDAIAQDLCRISWTWQGNSHLQVSTCNRKGLDSLGFLQNVSSFDAAFSRTPSRQIPFLPIHLLRCWAAEQH